MPLLSQDLTALASQAQRHGLADLKAQKGSLPCAPQDSGALSREAGTRHTNIWIRE